MMGSMMGLTDDMTDEGLAAGLKGMAGMMSQGNAKYTEKLYVRMGGVWVHRGVWESLTFTLLIDLRYSAIIVVY